MLRFLLRGFTLDKIVNHFIDGRKRLLLEFRTPLNIAKEVFAEVDDNTSLSESSI